MARTTIDKVKDIFPNSGATDAQIQAAITGANLLVTDQLEGNTGLGTDLLTEIERYVAAHFLVINVEGGNITRESTGDASESRAFEYGAGLSATRYGQQAMAFDPSNTLAQLGKKKATFRVYPRNLEK